MPDLTSRKSETDADRRRNEQQFAALAKGLANVENLGESERKIFDQIAASRPTSKGPRHRAASDIFADPMNDPARFEPMRQLGERMAREREETVFRQVFHCYPPPPGHWDNVSADVVEPPKSPRDNIIDAAFRILEDSTEKAAADFGMPPMLADAALWASFSNGRRSAPPLMVQNEPPIIQDKYRGGDPTA